MPDKNDKTFKENRADRQQVRINKLAQQRQEELKDAGLGEEIDVGPMTAERKARVDEEANVGLKGAVLDGIKKFQAMHQTPEVDVPEMPDAQTADNLDIKDVRRARRAKTADVLTSLGRGLQGKDVDTARSRNRLKEEWQAPYQQYKETSMAAKKTLEDYESGYIKEQLDYLDDLINDSETSALKRIELKKKQAQLQNEHLKGQELSAKIQSQKSRSNKEDWMTVTREINGQKVSFKVPKYEYEKLLEWSKELEAAKKNHQDAQDAVDIYGKARSKTKKEEKALLEADLLEAEEKLSELKKSEPMLIDEYGPTPEGESGKTGNLLKDILSEVQE